MEVQPLVECLFECMCPKIICPALKKVGKIIK